jgi:glycosyltransferase involved in cell wall biosynthesis
MVRDFNALGHKAYLITSVYHDGAEAIQAESLRKGKGYVFVEDPELDIPVIRVDSYLVKWPRRRISFRDFVQVLERIVDEFKLNVLITHSTLWNGPEEVAKFVAWRRYMKDVGGYKDQIVFCHMSHYQEPSSKRYSIVERTFRMAWNRFSLSQILRMANLVLVVTPLERDAKVKMGADPDKCLLFPSGVDEEVFLRYAAADPRKFQKERRIPENAKLVSFLGTLEKRKNPLGVLRVAELLKERKDIHFVIAGRGDSQYANQIKDRSSTLPNVTYLGEIDDKEKILLIKSSYINILLSRLEALGLAQLEFMYSGIPVITSAVGGQSWLVRNGKEGIHTDGPDDISGAAGAIMKLVDNHELWNKLSANAREKARNLASPQVIRELDAALTGEIMKESGLTKIPWEARRTLIEPENVLKTWSVGSWGAVATERRLFVKHGRFSRKVAEIPYGKISYIQHTRRYPWEILVAGFLPLLMLLLEPLWRTILNSSFISVIEELAKSIVITVPLLASPQILMLLLVLVPILVSLGYFGVQARTGFNLHGLGTKPVYLPHRFSEVITFIRKIQDQQNAPFESNMLNTESNLNRE